MKCEEMLAALNEYVDGEQVSSLCKALESHLKECNPCQLVVDNIRKTIAIYKAGQPIDLPQEIHDQLHNLLRERWKAKFSGGKAS